MFISLGDSLYLAEELLLIEKAGDRVIFTFDNKNSTTVTKPIIELATDFAVRQMDQVALEITDIPFVREFLDDRIYLRPKNDVIVNVSRISHVQTEYEDGDIHLGIYMRAQHFGVLSTKVEFNSADEAIGYMNRVFGKRGMILSKSLKK